MPPHIQEISLMVYIVYSRFSKVHLFGDAQTFSVYVVCAFQVFSLDLLNCSFGPRDVCTCLGLELRH